MAGLDDRRVRPREHAIGLTRSSGPRLPQASTSGRPRAMERRRSSMRGVCRTAPWRRNVLHSCRAHRPSHPHAGSLSLVMDLGVVVFTPSCLPVVSVPGRLPVGGLLSVGRGSSCAGSDPAPAEGSWRLSGMPGAPPSPGISPLSRCAGNVHLQPAERCSKLSQDQFSPPSPRVVRHPDHGRPRHLGSCAAALRSWRGHLSTCSSGSSPRPSPS